MQLRLALALFNENYMARKMLVFAYGTLMREERNNFYFTDNQALYKGEFTSAPEFTLFHMAGYPAAVKNGHTAIAGEIWQVDAPLLKKLDGLEEIEDDTGNPTGMKKERVQTPYGDAWMYIKEKTPDAPQIKSGNWREVCK